MQQKVEIVPAAEADLPEILSLAKAAFPDPWTEQQFRQTMCCCYSRIWCAKVAGEFCGYAAVSLAGDAVNLDDIAVAPAFRRRGIGRQLLDWAHRQFPENEFWLEVRESNARSDAKIDEILRYINGNLTADLSVDELGQRFYLSRSWLMHRFKSITGCPIHQYVLQKRLILAAQLLREGESVGEAAQRSGFTDYSAFLRAFRRAYGVSPREYR